jgi:hypothetical protein
MGRLPRKDTLDLLKSVYADSSEDELLQMMNFIKKRKDEQMMGGTGGGIDKKIKILQDKQLNI